MTRRPMRAVTLAVLATLFLAVPGAAQPIALTNAGFEQPAIASNSFSTTAPPPPGWSVYRPMDIDFGFRTVGVLDPLGSTLYAGPVPEGENVGVVFLLDDFNDQTTTAGLEAGMQQVSTTPMAANTVYRLNVQIGNIANDPNPPHSDFEFAGFPGYRVEITAGNPPMMVAEDDDGLLPAPGAFLESEVVLVVGASHPMLNEVLGVRLVNLNAAPGIEVNFDDVRLVAEPTPDPVPSLHPVAWAVLGGGVLAAAWRRAARAPTQNKPS